MVNQVPAKTELHRMCADAGRRPNAGLALIAMTEPTNPKQAPRRAAISARIEIAALELILERGFEAVTVEDIATASGISRRTFYRYFASIEDICIASPRRSLERIGHDIRARPTSENLRQALVAALRYRQVSAIEAQIKALGARICVRQREEWLRMMARLDAATIHHFGDAIAVRLRLAGRDASHAHLLAAVLRVIISSISVEAGGSLDADEAEAALPVAIDGLVAALQD